MSSERERAREELMGELSKPGKSHDIVRMNYEAFLKLCDLLERAGGLKPTRWSTVEEQVGKTLYILGHTATNRVVNFFFRRSGEKVILI